MAKFKVTYVIEYVKGNLKLKGETRERFFSTQEELSAWLKRKRKANSGVEASIKYTVTDLETNEETTIDLKRGFSMFDKIKNKIDPELREAVAGTFASGVAGVKIGLVAGAILLPLTACVILVEKAAR